MSYARIAQNLNAVASGAVDVKMFNSVEPGRSASIGELETGNTRTFASNVNKSIRGPVSYSEANTDASGASLNGEVLKVRTSDAI